VLEGKFNSVVMKGREKLSYLNPQKKCRWRAWEFVHKREWNEPRSHL